VSTEAYTIKNELDLLSKRENELHESRKKAITFMLSKEFVAKKNKFEEILSNFVEKAVSVVEAVETAPPMTGQQTQQPQPVQTTLPLPETGPKTTHLLAMAAIVVASIIAAGILELKYPEFLMETFSRAPFNQTSSEGSRVIITYTPGELLKWVAIGSALVMASPWIIDAARKLIESRREKEKLKSISVEWIHRNVGYMRKKHLGAWLLAKVQNQTKEDMPEYDLTEIDEVFYSRLKYLQATLSTEFISIIDKIVVACDRSIWIRKGVLISAIVQSRMAVGRVR